MSFWDQFEEIKGPVKETTTALQETPKSSDFWSQFEEVKAEHTLGQEALRIGAGGLASAFESAVGLPGDIEALVRPFIARGQKGEGGLIGRISEEKVLPTSQELKERAEKFHPELKPKGKSEELFQEIAGLTPLAPGGLLRKLGIASASVFGKEAAKELGASEGQQAGVQILTGVLASRFGKPNVKDFISEAYSKASRSIPVKATIPSKRAETFISSIKEKVNKGGHADWKDHVNKQIEFLEKNFKEGKVEVRAIDQAIKDINSTLGKKGVEGTQAGLWLNRIKKGARHELKQYGKENPEFWKEYQKANAAYSGYKQSLIAQRMVDKFKEIGLVKGTIGFLAEAAYKPELAAKTAGFIASAYGIKKSGELMMRIFSNPTLANYYLKATAAAAKENAPQFISNMKKLDAELKKTKSTNQSMQK